MCGTTISASAYPVSGDHQYRASRLHAAAGQALRAYPGPVGRVLSHAILSAPVAGRSGTGESMTSALIDQLLACRVPAA